MKNSTHYYFAVAVMLGDILLINPLSVLEKLLIIPYVILGGTLAFLPNKLEKWLCIDQVTAICTDRCRHPLTHHPAIVVVLLWIFSIIPIIPSYMRIYRLLTRLVLLAHSSHLLLDMINPEGLPLGFTPTLFFQDRMKNYAFNDATKSRKRLCIFHISRDSSNINHKLTLTSKLIVLIYCLLILFHKDSYGGTILFSSNLPLYYNNITTPVAVSSIFLPYL